MCGVTVRSCSILRLHVHILRNNWLALQRNASVAQLKKLFTHIAMASVRCRSITETAMQLPTAPERGMASDLA